MDSAGLVQCLASSLKSLGVEDISDPANVLGADAAVIVGVSTDGAAVNVGKLNGMKGKLQNTLPWLMCRWC